MFAFEAVYQRRKKQGELRREHTETIFEFEDEISNYLKKYLPPQNLVYGLGVISEVKLATEKVFKQSELPPQDEIQALMVRLALAASFIPEGNQDVQTELD